jgi:hypothetical protein
MKYIKYQIFIVFTLLCVSTSVSAQDVDKIIEKHIKAHGSIEKWESIENMEIKGRFTAFSVEEDYYGLKTNAGEYYSKLSLGQHKVIEDFDGEKGWTIDPWQDFVFPRELNKNEVNVFHQKAEFFTPFYKYKEKGIKVELLENQDVDGMEMIVIKLTRPDENVETWYLDASTYLEYKCESGWVDFAYPSVAESYFDDFRDIEGLLIPFFVERTFWQRDRILQIEEVDFNVDIEAELFLIPRTDEMEKLASLEGNWDVKVDVWSRRGSWYNIDSTVSQISWDATNMLQEKIKFDQTFVQFKTVNYTYNTDAEKYVFTIYNDFSSKYVLFHGQFNDSSLIAQNINIDYGDSTQKQSFTQMTIKVIDEDNFTIERMSSSDKGENWKPAQKLTYSRKKED